MSMLAPFVPIAAAAVGGATAPRPKAPMVQGDYTVYYGGGSGSEPWYAKLLSGSSTTSTASRWAPWIILALLGSLLLWSILKRRGPRK
jgi:hypothetical protein